MTEITRRIAVVALLATIGCGSEQCPTLEHTRTVGGEISLVESQASVDERVALWERIDKPADAAVDAASAPSSYPKERSITSVAGESYQAFAIDDPCPGGGGGCVRIGPSLRDGLTFRRPPNMGTYVLRDLGARVCEVASSAGGSGGEPALRCSEVDGTLAVREVAVDRFDADITVTSAAHLAPGPAAFGFAHLVARDEMVDKPCSHGCGHLPMVME